MNTAPAAAAHVPFFTVPALLHKSDMLTNPTPPTHLPCHLQTTQLLPSRRTTAPRLPAMLLVGPPQHNILTHLWPRGVAAEDGRHAALVCGQRRNHLCQVVFRLGVCQRLGLTALQRCLLSQPPAHSRQTGGKAVALAAKGHFVEAKQSGAGAARDRWQTTCALTPALTSNHVTSPQIGPCPFRCLPFPCFPYNPLLMSLSDGCNRPPPLPPFLSLPLHPPAPHLIVCTSISASLMGFAPLDTLLRRRVRMLMKSDALITPITLVPMPSHSGAEAMPCTTHIRAQQLKGAMPHAIKWLVHVRIQSITQQPDLHKEHDSAA